jgi:holo-[acyl-carrier protein] synthase
MGMELLRLDEVRRRLEEGGEAFATTTWTTAERALCFARKDPAPGLAARLAAKIAALSALGQPEGATPFEVEVVRASSGKPGLALAGFAARAAAELGVSSMHVTLTHAEDHVLALVMLEGER